MKLDHGPVAKLESSLQLSTGCSSRGGTPIAKALDNARRGILKSESWPVRISGVARVGAGKRALRDNGIDVRVVLTPSRESAS